MCVGEKKIDEVLMVVEREFKKVDYEFESIRYKFIVMLELLEDGLFYIDLDEKIIWVNDIVRD